MSSSSMTEYSESTDKPLAQMSVDALKRRRRRNRLWIPLAIVVAAVVLLVTLSSLRQPPERKPLEKQPLLVETIRVQPGEVSFGVRAQGTVEPRTATSLVAEVGGRIVSTSADFVNGGFFETGEVLLRIDPSDYETALRQAEATLASRTAQLEQEQARGELARRDWEKLGRSDPPNDLVLRRPQLAEATAAVRAAEAELARARRNLERTVVRAPYKGMVRSKRAEVGQFVNVGTPLADIFAVDHAEVRLPVSSEELAFLDLPADSRASRDGPAVRLSYTRGGRELHRDAAIVRSEGVVDPRNRMHYLVARIEDPYGLDSGEAPLPVGQFVDAQIGGRSEAGLVVLPRYLLENNGTVRVLNEEDQLEIQPVQVVRADREFVYISGGLEAGDRVITSAIEIPVPGMRLRDASSETAQPEAESTEEAVASVGAAGEAS